jgi:catechol 2,3-dioxygenase-like lactoylglutathione lyase family enzyme
MSITQVGTVIVPVSDQEVALEFWSRLGFEKRLDVPFGPGGRWLEVAPPGAATTLALVAAESPEVSFATADAAADHAALRAAGVDADEELFPMEPPMFTFRDPDGNRFRVVQRPA